VKFPRSTQPYVPMPHGWMYLTVVMDWFSRCVLSWRLVEHLGWACFVWRRWRMRWGVARRKSSHNGPGRASTIGPGTFTNRLETAGVRVEHGWTRAVDGQRVCGAFVAEKKR